jgi:hypothetical protein
VALRNGIRAGLLAVLLLGLAAAGWAQPAPRRVSVEVTVSHALDAKGAIDPRGKELNAFLKPQFRYGSLKVLQVEKLDLALDEVGTLELPNGRKFRVRPLDIGPEGVLLSVSVQGTLWTDMRVRNGHLVVIGAERYEEGKLVIAVEPSF